MLHILFITTSDVCVVYNKDGGNEKASKSISKYI